MKSLIMMAGAATLAITTTQALAFTAGGTIADACTILEPAAQNTTPVNLTNTGVATNVGEFDFGCNAPNGFEVTFSSANNGQFQKAAPSTAFISYEVAMGAPVGTVATTNLPDCNLANLFSPASISNAGTVACDDSEPTSGSGFLDVSAAILVTPTSLPTEGGAYSDQFTITINPN